MNTTNQQLRYIVNKYSLHEFKNDSEEQVFRTNSKKDAMLQIIYDLLEFKKVIVKFYHIQNVKPGTLSDLCSDSSKSKVRHDIFAGSGSYLVLYLKLFRFFSNQNLSDIQKIAIVQYSNQDKSHNFKSLLEPNQYLQYALTQFESMKSLLKKQDEYISYYMSKATIHLYGAQLYYYLKDIFQYKTQTESIYQYYQFVIKNGKELQYELLYGVPGFIYILLALQKFEQNIPQLHRDEFQSGLALDEMIFKLCSSTLELGIKNAGCNQENLPLHFRLIYTFHNKEYLGGAHGCLGVLQILMLAYQRNKIYFDKQQNFTIRLLECIQQTLDYIITYQFPSGFSQIFIKGNFPTSFKNKEDLLYQFCHGSPGAVAPFLQAYHLFKNQQYFGVALKSVESVWKFGLLKKGSGLCHGIPGNAYSFLTMYRETNQIRYYQYALKFLLFKQDKEAMEQIENYDFHDRYQVGRSDNPYSLMLGLVGDIVALIDFIEEDSGFPGYEL